MRYKSLTQNVGCYGWGQATCVSCWNYNIVNRRYV